MGRPLVPDDCTYRCTTFAAFTYHLPESEIYRNQGLTRLPLPVVTCYLSACPLLPGYWGGGGGGGGVGGDPVVIYKKHTLKRSISMSGGLCSKCSLPNYTAAWGRDPYILYR